MKTLIQNNGPRITAATPKAEVYIPDFPAEAMRRLRSEANDPIVQVEWNNVVFLHYSIPAEQIRKILPAGYELNLFEGKAIVSISCVTMENYEPCARFNPIALMAKARQRECFLNLRTYVHYQGEPGALFIWGWLSKPGFLPAVTRPLGLPCALAEVDFQYNPATNLAIGSGKHHGATFHYEGLANKGPLFKATEDPLTAFTLERYSGFFHAHRRDYVFRAWHPTWDVTPLEMRCLETDLMAERFPWIRNAEFAGAFIAPGWDVKVQLGMAHPLPTKAKGHAGRLSRVFELD